MFGWSGNMERLALSNAHQKSDGVERSYYLSQRKALEINTRHPIVRRLLSIVEENPDDAKAKEIALLMFRTGKTIIKSSDLFYI
jgi:heat shock protein beta